MKEAFFIVFWLSFISVISCSPIRNLETNAWKYRPADCSMKFHYVYNKYSGLCMEILCDVIEREVDCNLLPDGVKVYK